MTVYVDNGFAEGEWGVWNGGGHMLANDLDELHGMAQRLKLKREWFQKDSTFAHYDLTKGKRHQALKIGATPIEAGDVPDDVLMRRMDGTYERRCDRIVRRAREKVAKVVCKSCGGEWNNETTSCQVCGGQEAVVAP